MRDLKCLIEATFREWNNDNAPRLAAAVAFYTLLSLSPIVIVVVGVAGLVFGRAAAEGQLAWEIHDVVGWDAARVIQSIVHSARHPHAGLLAVALSAIMLVFGASSVVVELRSGLNTIWHIAPGPSVSNLKALGEMGKERFFSFGLVTGAGVLLFLSVAASAWIAAMGRFLGPRMPLSGSWLRPFDIGVSYAVIALLFAAIYRIVPDVRLQWSDTAIGAAVTALIFTAGKQLIALYLSKAAFASTYGAAGSFVIFLVWVYYSAQLFFLGAEFTKIYTRTYGSHASAARRPKARPETKRAS